MIKHNVIDKGVRPTSCYQQRIIYSARVFGITLRLAGGILLLSQVVKAVMSIMDGGGISFSVASAALFAILLLIVSSRAVLEKAIAQFATRLRRTSFAIYLYLFPFLLTAFILWIKFRVGYESDRWRYLSSEGGLSEYGTALAYLLVPLFAYPVYKQFWRQGRKLMGALYLLFAAGAFFVGMEEISWGQRILGFQEPEFWTKHNVQSEFTFHNFAFYQNHLLSLSFLVAGFVGSFCWIVLRYWQKQRTPSQQPALDLNYLLPDWPVSSFFYPIFLFYLIIDYTAFSDRIQFFNSFDQEHWELVMGLGVLLFAVISFFRQGREYDALNRSEVEPPSF